jgi:hypothetical protein
MPPDHKLPHVPGTVLLNDEAAHTEQITGGLKHGTGRDAHIVLAPQPSEDPNDPLNWSAWKKELCLVILVYGAMLNAATIGPLLNSSIVVIATDLNRSITDIVVISGYNLLAVGCTGYRSGEKHFNTLDPYTARFLGGTANGRFSLSQLCSPSSAPLSARPPTRTITFSRVESFKVLRPVLTNL